MNAKLLKMVILGFSTLFIFPQKVGSRRGDQETELMLNHTLSYIPHTLSLNGASLPTQTESRVEKVGKHFSNTGSLSPFKAIANESNINMTNKEDEKALRIKRQILKPFFQVKMMTKIIGESDTKFTISYINFIIDFAIFRGWSDVYILLPEELVPKLCSQVKEMLAKSEASLRSECGSYSLAVNATNTKSRLIVPVFSFYFLHSSIYKTDKSFEMPSPYILHSKMILPYRPSRPTFLLCGALPKNDIIEGMQLNGTIANYKWSLVSDESYNIENTLNDDLKFGVEDVYGVFGGPISQKIGEWSAERGLKIDTKLALGPTDFQGRTLRITSVAGPPVVFIHVSKLGNKNVTCSGYLPDILHIISQQLNFTYVVYQPLDKKFGSDEGNGSWNGMVGMLQRKEAEIALMSFSLTAARKTVMDFSPAVEYSSVRLLIRRDWQNAELKWSAYLRPLSADVWIAIPVFLLLGVITLAIFSYSGVLEISSFTSAWLLSSCFILQGQDEHSYIKVTPYRLVLGTFWVLSVVIFACYTARLTSFLAASNEVLPVNSLYEAIKSKWKVGLVRSSAFVDRIKESRVDVLRALYQRLSEDPSSFVETFEAGMDRVYKERYIFFTSELIPSYLIGGNCSFSWLQDKYFSGYGYMGYSKNLPFAPVISQRIADIRQSGQMKRLFRKWWGTPSVCFTSSGDAFLGMSMYETGTAFLILLLGVSLAVTLMVGELFTRSRNPLKQNEMEEAVDKSIINEASKNDSNVISSKAMLIEPQFANSFKAYSYNSDFSFYENR